MERSSSSHPSGTPASAQNQEACAVWVQLLPFLGPDGRVGIALMIIYLWSACGVQDAHSAQQTGTNGLVGDSPPHHSSYTRRFAYCYNIVTGFFPAWCLSTLELP